MQDRSYVVIVESGLARRVFGVEPLERRDAATPWDPRGGDAAAS